MLECQLLLYTFLIQNHAQHFPQWNNIYCQATEITFFKYKHIWEYTWYTSGRTEFVKQLRWIVFIQQLKVKIRPTQCFSSCLNKCFPGLFSPIFVLSLKYLPRPKLLLNFSCTVEKDCNVPSWPDKILAESSEGQRSTSVYS